MKEQKAAESSENTVAVSKESAQKALAFLVECAGAECDPKFLLQKLDEEIQIFRKSPDQSKVHPELNKKINAAASIVGLETHYQLAASVHEDLRPFVIEYSKQVIKEYDCKTPSEKALAETVVGSYARILQFTNLITRLMRTEARDSEVNGFYSVASKELDRANRHFITALTTLKQLKSPSLNVQIKTNTAFIAHNQQLNNETSHSPEI